MVNFSNCKYVKNKKLFKNLKLIIGFADVDNIYQNLLFLFKNIIYLFIIAFIDSDCYFETECTVNTLNTLYT